MREYIEKTSSNENEEAQAGTMMETVKIRREIDDIDLTDPNARERFINKFTSYSDVLVRSSHSVRYYFICNQILGLKSILREISNYSAPEYFKKFADDYRFAPDNEPWSIRFGIKHDLGIDAIAESKNNEENPADSDSSGDKQIGKALLHAFLSNFPLFGKPVFGDDYLKLIGEDGSMSKLKENTPIFEKGKDPAKHEKAVRNIEEIKISDFYGYAIDLHTLYRLLFETLIKRRKEFPETKSEIDAKSLFIRRTLDGEIDLSRSTMLFFLASVKGALSDVEGLKNDEEAMFDEYCELDSTRVNKMLNRMGYVNLGFSSDIKTDKMYNDLFEAEESEREMTVAGFIDAVDDFIDNEDFSPIPFEITRMTIDEKLDKLIEGSLRKRKAPDKKTSGKKSGTKTTKKNGNKE